MAVAKTAPVRGTKTAAKTVGSIATTILAKGPTEESHLRRLKGMTDEELIRLAVRCLDDKDAAQAEYDLICSLMEDRFPKEKAKEEIRTSEGTAIREVKTAYGIAEGRASDLQKLLGLEWSDFVETKTEYEVPEDRMDPLREKLGKDWKRFIKTTERVSLSRLATTQLRDPEGSLRNRLGNLVVITPTTRVSIKPLT